METSFKVVINEEIVSKWKKKEVTKYITGLRMKDKEKK